MKLKTSLKAILLAAAAAALFAALDVSGVIDVLPPEVVQWITETLNPAKP